jgi:hypothetical protein
MAMMSGAVAAQSQPTLSGQAAAWIAALAMQAGLSAVSTTGALAASVVTHDRHSDCVAYCDLLLLGTGSSVSAEYFEANSHVGYRIASVEVRGGADMRVQDFTPAQKLERVLDILKPNVTELASAFGVSRQAIYAWKAGEPISQSNSDRLDDLNRAADVFAGAGVAEPGRLLRRKFEGGKNLLDIVRDGGSAGESAKNLIEVIRREETQRRALDARLQARVAPSVQIDDIGVPMMSEWS